METIRPAKTPEDRLRHEKTVRKLLAAGVNRKTIATHYGEAMTARMEAQLGRG